MGRACCVLGCTSGGDVPSHQIPKNPDLFKKWKSMIYSEKIQHLTDEQISRCTVCCKHFANEDYLVTFRVRKLKRGIAPSLNLPNQPITDTCKLNIKTELKKERKDSESKSMPAENAQTKCEKIEAPEENYYSNEVALFEDLPETLEPASDNLETYTIFESISEITPKQPMEQIDSKEEVPEPKCKAKKAIRKRVRPTVEQFALFRRKKQAERYAKTSTIQKILSSLTLAERSAVEAKIRRSKYSPRVYIKVYHDIAKRKALSQS